MSTKYNNLTEYLANREDPKWRASFGEIEEILGFPLPGSARTYQAWWANQGRSQSLGWQRASWKAADLDLQNEKVTFVYVGGHEDDGDKEVVATRPIEELKRLTIAEAKAGLAATFGVEPEQIEITIKG